MFHIVDDWLTKISRFQCYLVVRTKRCAGNYWMLLVRTTRQRTGKKDIGVKIKKSLCRWVKIEDFDQEREFCFDFYVQGLPPGYFTHFGRPRPKITNRSFWQSCGAFDRCATNTWIRSFWGATMDQSLKILTWRNFGLLRQWSRKFPSTIYYPFWLPQGQKSRFGLFDQGVTKWVKFPNFSPGKSISHRNLCQWSRKFPSMIFYLRPYSNVDWT